MKKAQNKQRSQQKPKRYAPNQTQKKHTSEKRQKTLSPSINDMLGEYLNEADITKIINKLRIHNLDLIKDKVQIPRKNSFRTIPVELKLVLDHYYNFCDHSENILKVHYYDELIEIVSECCFRDNFTIVELVINIHLRPYGFEINCDVNKTYTTPECCN